MVVSVSLNIWRKPPASSRAEIRDGERDRETEREREREREGGGREKERESSGRTSCFSHL